MYKIDKDNLPELFKFLTKNGTDVFAPVRKGNQVNFESFTDEVASTLDLDTLKTVRSPKDFVLPQVEHLFDATIENKQIKLETSPLADKPYVIFGVRPCDVKGIEVLDNVYLKDPVDKFYQARRAQGVIISLACTNPQQTCFCKSFNIDAANPQGDIAIWLINDSLNWKSLTDKGANLTTQVKHLLQESSDIDEVEACQKDIQLKIDALPYSRGLPLDKFTPDKLLEIFNDARWDELSKACIACGTCTFICPTCQCYDVKDYDAGKKVKRYRCWDSCMYSDFTLMAHGNSRNTQKERFRQRYMHKLVYHPDKHHGEFSCVGCGRCVNKCPSSLNIVKVIKSFEVDN
ncbi:MAG: 4Fe-4S dicluster domain-containing protein [Defluviitaleaceae bacterium]|nr:4Fe-4S dicluster domain-containing protein [Defluviitaleaceae bacterium]